MPSEKEIKKLLEEHNRLVESLKIISKYENLIPNVKLAKLIVFFLRWLGFGDDIQLAFTKWVLCYDNALDGLDKDKLRKIGDMMNAWLQAEIEHAPTNKKLDKKTTDQLKDLQKEFSSEQL